MLAGAVAVSGMFTATNADALGFSLSGVFKITAVNYNNNGATDAIRSNKSQATEANFLDALLGSLGTSSSDIFDYSGALDFSQPHNGTNITTISNFLATGSGTVTNLDATFGAKTNSAGAGTGDGINDTPFTITTLYRITASSLNIASLTQLLNVRHDDGITALGLTGSVASIGPNTALTTSLAGLTGGAGDFTLYYASANGNPSILQVNAVPLPAAAWLLLGVAGALVAAKRRSALRAA